MEVKMKKYIQWFVLLGCLFGFGLILKDVLKTGTWILDDSIRSFIISFNNQFFTILAIVISKIGGRGGIAVITILTSLISIVKFKNKKIALIMIINILGVGVINHLLKDIIQRPRPEYRIMDVVGYSFPSGHSMGAMALWGLFIVIAYKYIKNQKLKWCLISLMILIILAIGASRVYLGVHYASDVIAGFSLSLAYLIIYINIVKCVIKHNDKGLKEEKNIL